MIDRENKRQGFQSITLIFYSILSRAASLCIFFAPKNIIDGKVTGYQRAVNHQKKDAIKKLIGKGIEMEIIEGKKLLSKAKWIWPEHRLYDLHNTYAHFRRDFTLSSEIEKAILYITADESYRLWINGKYVTRGPARGYQLKWPYDQVEISKYLVKGHNYFCVEAYNPGVSTYKYLSQMSAGLICAVDFGELMLVSDHTWISRLDQAHKRDTALYSRQLNYQEHVETIKDDRSWIAAEMEPEGWLAPEETVYGSMPWHDLEERGIPQLKEVHRGPAKVISSTKGEQKEDYLAWRNIAQGLNQVFTNAVWEKEKDGMVDEKLSSIEIVAARKGNYQAVVLDMGETVVGPSIITVEGGHKGEIIDIFYCEAINEDLSPVIPFPALCEASMANRLILSEAKTNFDFYQTLGFRYITLVAHENMDDLSLHIEVVDTGYPYQMKGEFNCSDQTLNDIWRICQRTEQVCSQDAYVDTPWREQAQWWGDARIQFWNTMAMDSDVRLFKRGIRSLAMQKVPNGLTYGHAPTMAHMCVCPDFSLVWVITIYDYYWQTGDLDLFQEQLMRVREVLSYFRNEAPRYKGLLSNDPRYWVFLDWAELDKTGTPTLYNMWYILALQKFSDLLKLAGYYEEAEDTSKEAIELQNLLEKEAFQEEAGLFCDGFDETGVLLQKYSVQSQVFAMLMGMKPAFHENMLQQRILPFLRGEKLEEAIPSAYWTSYVLTLAREKGYKREAVEYIHRMWAPMIPLSTTVEVFDSDTPLTTKVEAFETKKGFTSLSHAWSAHPLFHLMNVLGGVVQDSVAWECINYKPYFDKNLSCVHIKMPCPQGIIESSWERKAEGVWVQLKLPVGVTARINIPGQEDKIEGSFECLLIEE